MRGVSVLAARRAGGSLSRGVQRVSALRLSLEGVKGLAKTVRFLWFLFFFSLLIVQVGQEVKMPFGSSLLRMFSTVKGPGARPGPAVWQPSAPLPTLGEVA